MARELLPDLFEVLPTAYRGAAAEQICALEVDGGDMTIHDRRLIHGSFANPTDVSRHTLIFRLVDSEVRLCPERLPDPATAQYFHCTAQGRLDPDVYPLF